MGGGGQKYRIIIAFFDVKATQEYTFHAAIDEGEHRDPSQFKNFVCVCIFDVKLPYFLENHFLNINFTLKIYVFVKIIEIM